MRKELIIFLVCLLLCSCLKEKEEFILEGKWVVLEFKQNGNDVISKLEKEIPSLNFYINDKFKYPAIRFDDSIMVIPVSKNQRYKLKFQADKNLDNIEIEKLEKYHQDSLPSFFQISFLKKFEIEKNYKKKELILKSDDEKIRIINSEVFSNQIQSRFLD
ncbi:hypothetical protein C8P64_2006 [Christiangramia gaetbulicola]|uniref:Lipoprotein n=1 Tax=Christiangramia gaetbulicola TaxID=703340 RepID=A0A2T6AI35_9FLAO|nr:hypothetical protein [Christiangramia gaetbulicola]PTX43478.1 hypothetical protein C8P64_2006 [Christiangramia gaetbulicola]